MSVGPTVEVGTTLHVFGAQEFAQIVKKARQATNIFIPCAIVGLEKKGISVLPFELQLYDTIEH
jgi:cell fate regulator YaaT (PSP1 superfamily)